MSRALKRPLLTHIALLAFATCLHPCRAATPTVVSDGQISLAVDPASGVLLRIEGPAEITPLAAPDGMAESFRLVLALPGGTFATILGKDQQFTSSRVEGTTLTLSWAGPLRDTTGAAHDLAVQMRVTASGGALTFSLHVDNHTQGKLQEAVYPMIGGLTGLSARGSPADGSLWVPTSTPTEKPLALPFGDATFGYPGHMIMSFACVQSKSAGASLYFGCHDPVARHKSFRFLELAGAGGKDVFACLQHTPLTPPGGSFDGSPVIVRFVEGGWRAGGQVYREWFLKTFGLADPKTDWIRRQSFFLMTMFMLPEGTICYTFKDIPRWAKAAKEAGLGAVQISGWQMGGHDNGYPDYVPDPRLGTWKELEDGLRACHKMGLKVFFFANYQPVMLDSVWYKQELSKYREMAPDGGLTWNAGWGMGTLWARMGHPKLMTWADPGFPQFRKIIVDKFAALAKIGADGVHIDKMFPSAIDYNPDIPLSPDTSTWEGAVLLSQEVLRECRRYNPDWAMSFECNWDRMLQFGGATWWVGNQLITRQVFPENVETLAITQAYDYLGINNAVRDGHAVMLAPMNFCRGLDWPPVRGLARYIKEVKRLRDGLQETVFLGEPLGATQAVLRDMPSDGVQYATFCRRGGGHRACILTNSRREPRTLTFAGFEGGQGTTVRVHVPFAKARDVKLPAAITIPPERLVFVEEQGGAR